jgi:hypothetical protein
MGEMKWWKRKKKYNVLTRKCRVPLKQQGVGGNEGKTVKNSGPLMDRFTRVESMGEENKVNVRNT